MAELSKDQQSEAVQSPPKRKSRSGLWLTLGIVFSALCLGALIFYVDLMHKQQQQLLSQKLTEELNKKDRQVMELTEQISGYQTQIAAIQSQLANVQQDSSGKDTHFNQALDDFSKLYGEKLEVTRNELKGSIDQVHRLLSKTRSDWMVADAEYLLAIANERVQLVGDVVTAKQAMESADSRLRESEDPAIYKVRAQLGKEIKIVSKVKPLDIVSLYTKLNTLQRTAEQLTLFLPHAGNKPNEQVVKETLPSTPAEKHAGWLDDALQGMKGYVSIRHSSKPIEGIISREQVQFIIQQLKVRLELVKTAVVQQNEALYAASLEDTQQWVNENFTMDERGKDFSKQLKELQAIQLRSHLPDISESLKMLKDITKMRIDSDKILPAAPPAEPIKGGQENKTSPSGGGVSEPAPKAAPEAVKATNPQNSPNEQVQQPSAAATKESGNLIPQVSEPALEKQSIDRPANSADLKQVNESANVSVAPVAGPAKAEKAK